MGINLVYCFPFVFYIKIGPDHVTCLLSKTNVKENDGSLEQNYFFGLIAYISCPRILFFSFKRIIAFLLTSSYAVCVFILLTEHDKNECV